MDTKQLKAKILDLAIHGKLLPLETLDGLKNSPDYEPASKLLEKLRAEKEEKIAKGELKRDKKDSYIFIGDDNRHYEKFADGSVKDIEDEIPFEAPEGWAWCRLGELCSLEDGKKETKKLSYLDAKHFRGKGTDIVTSGKYVPKNTYLILVDGENSGEIFFTKQEGFQGSTFKILRIDHLINDTFILYRIKKEQELLRNSKVGSAIPHLNKKLFKELYIALPPLAEQKLIVAEIEKIFNLIDSIETDKSALQLAVKQAKSKILDLAIHGKIVPQDPADEPAAALLEKLRTEKEAKIAKGELKRDKNDSYIYKSTADNCHYEKFSDGTEEEIEVPFEIPSSWSWCRLGTICDYGKCKNASAGEINDETWVLDLEDIEKDSGRILKFVSFKVRKSASTKHIFKKGDILYSKLRPYLNKVVIAPKDGVCTSEILPLDFKGILINEFAQYLLMSSFFLESINLVTYGIKMPRLGTDDAKKMLLPVPPLNEQLGIVKKIKQFQVMLDQIALNLV